PRAFKNQWKEGANALYCYTCDREQSNWRCLKAEKCSDKDEYCVTNVASVGIGKDTGHRITKKCSADCPDTNVNFGMAAFSTKCCGTSLCNFSGANSVKISYAVMFLGIVASLVCVIRAGL
uniref:UPAR/Ly6 domain-containing protein n=1 Tax=Athene cunicularia TaxID=194338 RepID=A0A663LQS5_ATHCN